MFTVARRVELLEPSPRPSQTQAVPLDEVAGTAGASGSDAAPAVAPAAVDDVPRAGPRPPTARERRTDRPQTADGPALGPAPRRAPHGSRCVALVITEPAAKLFGDPFFSPFVRSTYATLAERSMLMVLLTLHSSQDMALAESYLTGGHVDGAILVSLHGDNPLPMRLRERGVPTVICGRPPKGMAVSSVDSDNRQGAVLAVNHLIEQGRRRIAVIAGNLDMPSAIDRLGGYREALADAGIRLDPTLEEVGDYQPHRAHMAMERLLLNHPDVDAVFACSDLMAAAAVKVLQQARKRIPDDVAIIGFDDSPTARATRPELSSIRQPIDDMVREAIGVLTGEMPDPDGAPREIILPTELVVRESTVGPARAA